MMEKVLRESEEKVTIISTGAQTNVAALLLAHPELKILSESDEAGVFMVSARNGREIFITGHMEYSPDTLDVEY